MAGAAADLLSSTRSGMSPSRTNVELNYIMNGENITNAVKAERITQIEQLVTMGKLLHRPHNNNGQF